MTSRILTLGLPSGSLMEATINLFAKAGFSVSGSTRSYRPAIDDPELEIRLLRAQEISRYVEHGYLDAGITGRDWVAENESDVREITELSFSKASARPTRWVLVVPEESPIRSVQDLEGKRVATEAVGLTRRFFERSGVHVEIEFSWGATEVKVPDLVDAIIDITETGSSLRANKLRIVETLLGIVSRIYRQPPGFRGQLEARETRNADPPAQGRNQCQGLGRPEDESSGIKLEEFA